MADDVVHNNPCVGIVANGDALRRCERLPLAVHIVDEVNERCWSVRRAKGHGSIPPFDGIWSLESKFLLAGRLDGELMVARWGVKKPQELASSKFPKDR